MKLLLMTPSVGKISILQRDMITRLAIMLKEAGHNYATTDDTTAGLLHHSRNVLLATLAKRSPTWGFWLDSDVTLDPKYILAAMQRHEEVIVWNYPVRDVIDLQYPPEHLQEFAKRVRGKPKRWASPLALHPNGQPIKSDDGKLLMLRRAAFGAVLMRPSAAIAVAPTVAKTKPDWAGHSTIPAFDLIENRVGEDYSFCDRYLSIGGRLWCDPTAYVNNGTTGGRFADEIAKYEAYRPGFTQRCVVFQQQP